ncbi:hypothetical protein NKR23_g1306 [Pleurostoma richardsiae]|uniref:Uncharacterized protein n=1 Tax=Pleurostoma richardsiae TaxID=41990 RepID=A0AA38VWQ1_9PEZI|nr:hypothetical protein NKR23_g1306 [Pleurostoma richardsiae]
MREISAHQARLLEARRSRGETMPPAVGQQVFVVVYFRCIHWGETFIDIVGTFATLEAANDAVMKAFSDEHSEWLIASESEMENEEDPDSDDHMFAGPEDYKRFGRTCWRIEPSGCLSMWREGDDENIELGIWEKEIEA